MAGFAVDRWLLMVVFVCRGAGVRFSRWASANLQHFECVFNCQAIGLDNDADLIKFDTWFLFLKRAALAHPGTLWFMIQRILFFDWTPSSMMLNNSYRKKLLHAVLYFASKVRNPSKVKIFKLLYFLDFEHFRQTGKSVTNLDYFAYDFGPVPREFYQEVGDNEIPEDFAEFMTILPFESEESGKKGGIFRAKAKPNLTVFSPREQEILEMLVFMFKDVDAKGISDISHFKNHPWDKTIKQHGKLAKIEYSLALDGEALVSADHAQDTTNERQEMLKNFPLKPRI